MTPRVRPSDAGRVRAFLRRPGPSFSSPSPGSLGEDLGACADGASSGARFADEPSSRADLAHLRHLVAAMEGRIEAGARLESGHDAGPRHLPLGVPAFDGLFAGGGLPLAALTELRTAETRAAGTLAGFLAGLAVAVGAVRRGPVLWAREARVAFEAGRPAPLGLVQLGFDPARLLTVEVREAADVLWAVEEGLGCRGLSAVVGELQGLPKALDLTASRRLALRARESGVPVFLASLGAPEAASAAATRIAVSPLLSAVLDGFEDGPGLPAFQVTVEKNRDGRTGVAALEWSHDERRFRAAEAGLPIPQPLAAASSDRPARPGLVGEVVALGAGRGDRRAAGR